MSQVVKAYPPNYETICKHIPAVRRNPNIVFTYGDTLYNPAGNILDEAFLAHEQVHVDRQANPEGWWTQYLTDVQFRLAEEVLAYRVQYQYAVEYYSRAQRRRLLQHITADLSGPMYGNLITKFQAAAMITNEAAE